MANQAPAFARDQQLDEALRAAQIDRVLRHVPMLYAIAALNLLIVMAVCYRETMQLLSYGWLGFLALFCIIRMVQWQQRSKVPIERLDSAALLRTMAFVAISAMTLLSGWACYAFATGLVSQASFFPISLAFGATCIAHCLAPIRKAAIGALVIGIAPSAVTMAMIGSFHEKMLGVSMLTIAILMIRFVGEQYQQLVAQIALECRIRAQANTDPLTGLANRRAVMTALEQAHRDLGDGKPAHGIALLDLDGFKQLNDQWGHHMGDALLREVSTRLQATLGPSDLAGRLGGDEFIVILGDAGTASALDGRTTHLLAALVGPVLIDGVTTAISASLGQALARGGDQDVEALLREADAALYAAKAQARARPGAERRAA